MIWRRKIRWLVYLPAILVLWPVLWRNVRQRRKKEAPDEWHWADLYLLDKGYLVCPSGLFPWEKSE